MEKSEARFAAKQSSQNVKEFQKINDWLPTSLIIVLFGLTYYRPVAFLTIGLFTGKLVQLYFHSLSLVPSSKIKGFQKAYFLWSGSLLFFAALFIAGSFLFVSCLWAENYVVKGLIAAAAFFGLQVVGPDISKIPKKHWMHCLQSFSPEDPEQTVEKLDRIVVYLRPFATDDTELIKPSGQIFQNVGTVESILLEVLSIVGPCFAVHDQRASNTPLGAIRIYGSHSEWHPQVESLLVKADLVFIWMGLSSGISWEIEAAFRICSRTRIVLMPPCRGIEDASKLEVVREDYDRASAELYAKTGVRLPTPVGAFGVINFRDNGQPQWVQVSGKFNALSLRSCLARAVCEEIEATQSLQAESSVTLERERRHTEAVEDIRELMNAWERFLRRRRIANVVEYCVGLAGAAYTIHHLIQISWSGSSALFGYIALGLYLMFVWQESTAIRGARHTLKELKKGGNPEAHALLAAMANIMFGRARMVLGLAVFETFLFGGMQK